MSENTTISERPGESNEDESAQIRAGRRDVIALACRERCEEIATREYAFPRRMTRLDWTVLIVQAVVFIALLYVGVWL